MRKVVIGLLLAALAFIAAASSVRLLAAGDNGTPLTPFPAEITDGDQFWRHAKMEVDRSVLELIAQHKNELIHGIRYHKLMHGDLHKKQIALTFDDGPHPKFTPKLLAFLKQQKVKATFFVVGEMAEKYPWLIREEIADGHSVGNHTYHHVNLTKIPPEYVATELKACGEVLAKITGKPPHLFRPPGGDYDRDVAEISEALGYTIVLWTDDPGDYAKPGDKVISQRLLKRVSNGGIILIHDGIQQTLDDLPQFIATMRKRGFEFVTIDEMLKH